MKVNFDVFLFQFGFKLFRTALAGVVGDDNASHIQAPVQEFIPEAEHIHIIGDAQISPDFIFLNIHGADGDDDFCIIGKLHQHLQLCVRCKTGKHPGSVIIVKKFSTELQV